MTTQLRLWIGVGATVLLGSSGDPSLAQRLFIGSPAYAAGAEGGEGAEGGAGGEAAHGAHAAGGEGGESGPSLAAEPATVARPVYALLMLGHLHVGDELARAGRSEEAATHFAHPHAELFDDFAKTAAPEQALALEQALTRLVDAAVAKGDVAAPYAAASGLLWDLAGDAPAPSDVARALSLATGAAADEYAEAVKDGAVVNLAEYQDGRGFVSVAQSWLSGQAGAVLKGADAPAADALAAAVTELAAAWPTLDAPAAPADPAQVRAAASRVELKASAFR